MGKLFSVIKHPLIWLSLLIAFFASYNNYTDGEFDHVISSDGRGYYAYLPAIFIFNDNSYQQSMSAEKKYKGEGFEQAYLYLDKNGRTYNKYFPGVAVLQSPFFLLGCLTSAVTGNPIDGYSSIFQFSFFLGSLFYTLLGLFLFSRFLKKLFPDQSKLLDWFILLVFGSSTLLMYSTNTLGFTHHYSFCLFGLFGLQILQLKENFNFKRLFYLGLTLGLIALVRPTNILVVLIIPFLVGDSLDLVSMVQGLFKDKLKPVISTLGGFLLIISLLFFTWKWQSGKWFVWSYSGEGFNFLNPQLIENLFGFRIGLFLHSPLLILSVIGTYFLFKNNKFQALSWWLYFIVNAWVISSWWCWDYESTFGNRPFTEHVIFLVIPIIYLAKELPRFTIPIIMFFTLIGALRYGEYISGHMMDQRFTKNNYLSSLAFWDKNNRDRWRFIESCPPFGKLIEEDVLLENPNMYTIGSDEEFLFTAKKMLDKPRTIERYYYSVELEERLSTELQSMFLVVDATNNDESKRLYSAVELVNDRKQGLNEWNSLRFSGLIPDNFQQFDRVTIYLWNPGKNSFEIRNLRIVVKKFKA